MKRIWVAFLTIVIYALAQFLPLLAQQLPFFKDLKGMEFAKAGVYTQVILFVIAALLIIWLNSIIKNPTALERGYKEPKRYILPWALLGFVVVMIYQMVASLITMWLVGQPQQSPNTERIMAIAKQLPVFILLISIVGPILEEYIFRKVIFGEIYNKIKGNRIVAFLIASIVSSILFAIAHNDIKFFFIYFGMGMLFSLAYVLTRRIAVPIIIHMLQNGFVVAVQFFFGDTVKHLQEQSNFIIHFLF